jgi:hypothetical protein
MKNSMNLILSLLSFNLVLLVTASPLPASSVELSVPPPSSQSVALLISLFAKAGITTTSLTLPSALQTTVNASSWFNDGKASQRQFSRFGTTTATLSVTTIMSSLMVSALKVRPAILSLLTPSFHWSQLLLLHLTGLPRFGSTMVRAHGGLQVLGPMLVASTTWFSSTADCTVPPSPH